MLPIPERYREQLYREEGDLLAVDYYNDYDTSSYYALPHTKHRSQDAAKRCFAPRALVSKYVAARARLLELEAQLDAAGEEKR